MSIPDLDIDEFVIECLNIDNRGTFKKLKKEEKKDKRIWAKGKEVLLNVDLMYDRIEVADPELFEDLIVRYEVTEEEMYGINFEINKNEKNSFQKKVTTSRVLLYSQKDKETNEINYELAIYDEKKDKMYELNGFKKVVCPDSLNINVDGFTYPVLEQFNDEQTEKKYAIYRDDYTTELKIAEIKKETNKQFRECGINLCTKNQWALGMPEEKKIELLQLEKNIQEETNNVIREYVEFIQREQSWRMMNKVKQNTWNKTKVFNLADSFVCEKISIEDKEFLKEIADKYEVKKGGMYTFHGNEKEHSRVLLVATCNDYDEKIDYNLMIEDDEERAHKIYGFKKNEPKYLKKIAIENESLYIKESHIVNEFQDKTGETYIAYRDEYGELGMAQVEDDIGIKYRNFETYKHRNKMNEQQNEKYQKLKFYEKLRFDRIDKPVWLLVTENIVNIFRNLFGVENTTLALPMPKTEENGLIIKSNKLDLYKNKEVRTSTINIIKKIFIGNKETNKEY